MAAGLGLLTEGPPQKAQAFSTIRPPKYMGACCARPRTVVVHCARSVMAGVSLQRMAMPPAPLASMFWGWGTSQLLRYFS